MTPRAFDGGMTKNRESRAIYIDYFHENIYNR